MSSGRASRYVLFCAVIGLLASIPWSSVLAEGPAEAEPVVQTREVVVSSTRLPDAPIDPLLLPAKVTVITAQDIQKSGAKTVQEALQWATGIVMYDQLGNAFQQSIDLRGFNGQPVPSTTVFVDGMRMNEPDFNAVNFDLIPFDTIERIEILPGASAIYGKNALGGVINVITKRGTGKAQVTQETAYGSFGRQRYTTTASGPIGKFDYYANYGKESENGYRKSSGADISRFFGKVGYRPTADSDLTLSYTFVDDKLYQAGSLPVSLAYRDPTRNLTPGDFFAHETNVVRLNGRQVLPFGFTFTANAFYRQAAENSEIFGQPFDAYATSTNSISRLLVKTASRGEASQLTQDTSFGSHRNTFVVGEEFTRSDMGNRYNTPGASTGTGGPWPAGSSYTSPPSGRRQSIDQDMIGLYVQDTLNLASTVIVTGGLRYDHDQMTQQYNDPDKTASENKNLSGRKRYNRLTPRVGVSYLFTPSSSLYMNYGEAFRVPTYNELWAISGGSSPDLRAVHSKTYEVGAKSRIGAWGEGSVALFQSLVTDEILQVCALSTTTQQCTNNAAVNTNIPKSRRQGVETTMKARYGSLADVTVNYTYTQATIESNIGIAPFWHGQNGNTAYREAIKAGSTFAQVPKHRLGVTGNYHPGEGWTLSMQGLYVSTQFHMNDDANVQARIPGYFVTNVRLAYERPVPGGHLSGFLSLNNLLNHQYSTSGIIAANNVTGGGAVERFVVPAPGLAVFGGLSYRFEGL
ncbi:MAG: TonB-dependent receptor [Nitrospiraceae bacterium]|nr:TonB-dependent receptor [Nitrospiraceae bacterium]